MLDLPVPRLAPERGEWLTLDEYVADFDVHYPEHFEVVSSHDQVTGMWHPACNPVVRLKGCRKPVSLASVHLSSWDPTQRASEARRLPNSREVHRS